MKPLAPLLALLSSCASLQVPKRQAVSIETEPPGAKVFYEGKHVGTTPCVVLMVPKESQFLAVHAEGHHPMMVDVDRHIAFGWLLVDLLTVPLFLVVDLMSESYWKIDDEPLVVPLVPASQMQPGLWRRPKQEKRDWREPRYYEGDGDSDRLGQQPDR